MLSSLERPRRRPGYDRGDKSLQIEAYDADPAPALDLAVSSDVRPAD